MAKLSDMPVLQLETMCGGALPQMFDEELMRVMANIADPNTDATKVRSITIKVEVQPTKDRDTGTVTVTCKPTLAGVVGKTSQIFLGTDADGNHVATEFTAKDRPLFKVERVITPVDHAALPEA